MGPALFAELFRAGVRDAGQPPLSLPRGACRSADGAPCGLCFGMTIDYATEARVKADAAARFWSGVAGSDLLSPLVPSPRGRAYRTVSKRKIFRRGRELRLGLIDPAEGLRSGGISVGRCMIEPDEHAAIYREIEARLRDRSALPLTEVLQYVIIKGNYLERSILFNVRQSTPAVVRAVNGLSRSLTARFAKSIAGVFLFEGEEEGRYYLAPRRAGGVPRVRKVFGKGELFLRVDGRPFLYPPLAFSQVNESILPLFVSGARTLLSPAGSEMFFDLYCGYGLFGLSLAPLVRRVVGAEASHIAVAAARENARRQKISHARFVRALLNGDSVQEIMAGAADDSLMLLDPPRNGTAPGIIEAAAAFRPARVVHIFCNMELLEGELLRWRNAGYRAERGIPFDMFPGTPELEMMVLLTPSA